MKHLGASAIAAAAALFAAPAWAILPKGVGTIPPPLTAEEAHGEDGTALKLSKRLTGSGTFQQLIDHSNPSLGTFTQRWWWSSEFYAGPGSPVVFFTPGEVAAPAYTGYLTNRTITGLFAQAIGGAGVLLEHRYWGTSSPVANLTVQNLQYLTLANSIADTTYFANNVVLPFDTGNTSHPSKAPWVFSGGSYSGALSAWVNAVDPGTYWAYHASSAVVETIRDFWQYFDPVRQGLPANCSSDVQKVVKHIDGILLGDDAAAKTAIKAKFNLTGIEHDDDFMNVLQNGPWTWQGNDFTTGYSSTYQFCDYIENRWPGSNTTNPGAEGVGTCKALNGYAKWVKELVVPGYCAGYGYKEWTDEWELGCFNSRDKDLPFYHDIGLDNIAGRQWMWFLCNEPLAFWEDGADRGQPSVVSSLIKPPFWEAQCALFFPPEGKYSYGLAEGKTPDDVNKYTGGWDYVNTTRLMWANGELDPWRDATVSADFRPGGPLASTPEAPVNVIKRGIHCPDLLLRNAQADPGTMAVLQEEIAIMKGWVEEFYA